MTNLDISIFSIITLFLSKVALAFGFYKLWQGSLSLLWFFDWAVAWTPLVVDYVCMCVHICMYISSFVGSYFLTSDLLGGDCWHTIWTLGCALSFLGFLLGWSANQDLFTFNPVYHLKRNLLALWPFLACFRWLRNNPSHGLSGCVELLGCWQ